MRIGKILPFCVLCGCFALAPAAFASGEGCLASEIKRVEAALKKAEEAEKAGRNKDAHQIVVKPIGEPGCAANGYKRRDGLLERTSRKLGAEAEKAGRFGEAFEYYSAPYRQGRGDHLLADADRMMLKHAQANPDSYKIASEAAAYFERREGKSQLKEVHALAHRGGERVLAKEEKSFAARRNSLDELGKARDWYRLAGDARPVTARAEQRGDTLLGEGTVRSVDTAIRYYQLVESKVGERKAQERARKLGDEAQRKGEQRQAVAFYELAGDHARAEALQKKTDAEAGKTETTRQDKFKKDQQALEKELGL